MNLDALGTWVEAKPFCVTRERVADYAAATGDSEPLHAGGEVAPPVFSALVVHDSVNEAIRRLIGPELAEDCLHGEHAITLLRPLRGGEIVGGRAATLSIRPTRAGTAVLIKAETIAENGEVVTEHYFTSILPGRQLVSEVVGEVAVPRALPPAVEHVVQGVSWIPNDITYRYADVSGDHHRYHTDPTTARAAGFENVIVHGFCTLALASIVLVEELCRHEPTRLVALGARFSAPLFPGQTTTTSFWPGTGSRPEWGFEMADQSGRTVLRNGVVVVKPISIAA